MQGLDIFSVGWVLAFCTVLFASFIRGISGFGAALILAPILLLIIGSKSVVGINLLLGTISNAIVVACTFRHISLKVTTPMAICSLAGIPLGVWVITVIDAATLKVLIGLVTISFGIPLALGLGRAFTREALAGGVAGFISGILSSSTSMGGPPVVMFMHNQNWRKEIIYGSLAVYFLFLSVCSLLALAIRGFMDMEAALYASSLVPALLIGTFIGLKAFRKLNARFFRWLTLGIVICAGILGIVSGLGWLS